jgi:hypothetical protein
MADLSEAFNALKFQSKKIQTIDYFFTQRTIKEDREYIDKNMNRKNKKINIVYNFLALNIPNYNITEGLSSNISIEIFGDFDLYYKGKIQTTVGCVPNIMIPIKGDKKIFAHIEYNEINSEQSKEYTVFIDVPKRFQMIENYDSEIVQNSDSNLHFDTDLINES